MHNVHIYIYIYTIYISLSMRIYIYIYIYTYTHIMYRVSSRAPPHGSQRFAASARRARRSLFLVYYVCVVCMVCSLYLRCQCITLHTMLHITQIHQKTIMCSLYLHSSCCCFECAMFFVVHCYVSLVVLQECAAQPSGLGRGCEGVGRHHIIQYIYIYICKNTNTPRCPTPSAPYII